jgi:putative PIG3 family NAD(P)H quinone oxidoreductase
MPVTARAVRIREPGDASVLELVAREVRDPGPGEVRVAVRACGLNRADLLQRRGLYPAPPGAPPDVPGLEHAGVVDALGEGVTEWSVGDRVMGVTGGGAMASHLVCHARELVRVPAETSFLDAAAIPEVFMTAWDALFVQADLRPGACLLVHAIASGVGTAALQIGKRSGARVIGTSRSPTKMERCEQLGLDEGIVVTATRELPPRFAEQALALTGGRGVDVVIDTVGGAYLEENVRALAPRGTVVCLGLLAGVQGTLPMGLLLAKRARVVGSVLRSRPLEEKIALAGRFEREAIPLFESGDLHPVVDRVLPLAAIADAHRAMEADANVGKIVLEV